MAGLQAGGQTDYGFAPVSAVAGMRYSTMSSDEVVHGVASGTVQPGQLVESYGGQLRAAQSENGALYPIVGVALFRDSNVAKPNTSGPTPAYYLAGEQIPVMRKGRIYTQWSGTTQGGYVTANYVHSSDGTHGQGVITDAATQSTTGNEIDALPGGIRVIGPTNLATICLLELNLPGD